MHSIHQHGQGGLVNYVQAIALYEQAISSGDTNGMHNRAKMHKEGQGGPVDHEKVRALRIQAIELEIYNSLHRTGSIISRD